MKSAGIALVPILAATTGLTAAHYASANPYWSAPQERYPSQVEITGHIDIPERVAPTPANLSKMELPEGFKLTKFAAISGPRILLSTEDGTVYASSRDTGTVTMLKDLDGDGVADQQRIVFRRINSHGIALRDRMLYVVASRELWRSPILADGTLGKPQLLVGDLPDSGQHNNRTASFGPDGKLYISCGSTCNECDESNEENATLLRMDPDGKNREIFASGLRNTIGFGWHPVSKKLYGMDHGIDWLGDDDQPEELNEVQSGKRYGWPYIYAAGKANPHRQPPSPYTTEGWRSMSTEPLLTYTAHAAPMQLAFNTGSNFPVEMKNDGFQAMHGSWNRTPPSGYEVVRIDYDEAGAPREILPFVRGFLQDGIGKNGGRGFIGRPVGLAQLPDGAMLISDDTNNIIYRLSNQATPGSSMPDQDAITLEKMTAASRLTVRSAAFPDNGAIPAAFTEYGEKKVPDLSWGGVPAQTKSIVVVMEDSDTLSPKPLVHWLVANIDPTAKGIPAGLEKRPNPSALPGSVQGAGNSGEIGYYGPKPPAADAPHAYHFQVFALDRKLDLPAGFTRAALTKAIVGHVLAKGETIGTYDREG